MAAIPSASSGSTGPVGIDRRVPGHLLDHGDATALCVASAPAAAFSAFSPALPCRGLRCCWPHERHRARRSVCHFATDPVVFWITPDVSPRGAPCLRVARSRGCRAQRAADHQRTAQNHHRRRRLAGAQPYPGRPQHGFKQQEQADIGGMSEPRCERQREKRHRQDHQTRYRESPRHCRPSSPPAPQCSVRSAPPEQRRSR